MKMTKNVPSLFQYSIHAKGFLRANIQMYLDELNVENCSIVNEAVHEIIPSGISL